MPLVIAAVLAGALLLGLLSGNSWTTELLIVCAVAPGLLVLERVVRGDRFPEPAGLLLVAFMLGAFSCFPAGIAEHVIAMFTTAWAEGSSVAWLYQDFSAAFLQAGVCEETAKYLILVLLCLRWQAFDEPIDGVVYGVATSLGFAALENVFYVVGQPGLSDSFSIALDRAVTAVPAHAVDGAAMGFFVGLSRVQSSSRAVLLALAWAIPVALHGAYDFLLFINPRVDGALTRLWWALLLYEITLAARLFHKLQELQQGASAVELVRRVRSRLWLGTRVSGE